MLSSLQEQPLAAKKSAAISTQLAKLAEQKLKVITTALNQFQKKNKREYPVSRLDLRNEEIDLDFYPSITMKNVPVGTYSSGDPITKTVSYVIHENRFWRCNYGMSDTERKLFGKNQVPYESSLDKPKTKTDPYTICATVTSPTRIVLVGRLSHFSVHTDLKDKNGYLFKKKLFVEISKDQVKAAKPALEKDKYSILSNINANDRKSTIWKTANVVLDQFQDHLVASAKNYVKTIDADEQYLRSASSPRPIRL